MFRVQCAGCLRDFNIIETKRIGKYRYCQDCQKYIVDKLVNKSNGNSDNV